MPIVYSTTLKHNLDLILYNKTNCFTMKLSAMRAKGKISMAKILFIGLFLITQNSYAGIGSLFVKFIDSDVNPINSIYFITGVILAALVTKTVQMLFLKDDRSALRYRRNHIYHHRKIIKKTN